MTELQERPGADPVTRVLVLYYSSYGHVEAMAAAMAEVRCRRAPRSW
jgi:hypothetical protein